MIPMAGQEGLGRPEKSSAHPLLSSLLPAIGKFRLLYGRGNRPRFTRDRRLVCLSIECSENKISVATGNRIPTIQKVTCPSNNICTL